MFYRCSSYKYINIKFPTVYIATVFLVGSIITIPCMESVMKNSSYNGPCNRPYQNCK